MSGSSGRYEGYGLPVGEPVQQDTTEVTQAPPPLPRRRGWLVWALGGGVIVLLLILAAVWFLRSPVGVLGRAVVTTLEAGSARTRVTATVGGVPLLGEVDVGVAEGAVDFGSGEARLSRRIIGGVDTELRYVDDGVYLRVPVADDRWVRLSEGEVGTGGGDTSAADVTAVAPGIGNPIAFLGLIQTLEDEPRKIGTTRLGGDPITVYEAIVDLDDAAALAGDETRTVVRRLQRLTGDRTLPVRVGIDEARHIRFLAFSATLELSRLLSPRIDNRIEFSDFGVEVDVATPSEDRLVDLDPSQLAQFDLLGPLRELLGAGLEGAGGLISAAPSSAAVAAGLTPPAAAPGTPG